MTRTQKLTTPADRTLADHAAYLISILCSPFLVLPALLLGATWRAADSPEQFGLWSLIALIFFIVIPPAFVYYEVRAGRITDYHVALREQRAMVFLVFLASTALGIGIFWLLGVPNVLFLLTVVVFCSALIAALITLFWKISIHAWAIAGSVTAFVVLSDDPRWWWALIAVPLIIWARVHRHRHSPAQGFLGALVGIIVTYLLYQLLA